jgi:hypothetical protein
MTDATSSLIFFTSFFFDSFFFFSPSFFLGSSYTMIRWNIFNFNHIAYLEAWSKLEGTSFSDDVEHDLPLANINSSSHGLEEGPPKDERRLLPLSHLEHHEVDGDEMVFDLHGHISTMPKG